jgi:heme-degrading monooxygenase HmoA
VLSLSTWRDEKAVVRWRTQGEHHRIQEQGRNGVFSDYHLRVCEVTADTHPPEGSAVIEQRLDETETGDAKALAITEISPATNATFAAHAGLLPGSLGLDVKTEGLIDYDVFESIYSPGKMLVLSSWKTAWDCARWETGQLRRLSRTTPSPCPQCAGLRHVRTEGSGTVLSGSFG